MRFVTSREFRTHPGKIWVNLEKETELVVTINGKPIGLLTRIDPGNMLDTITAYRQARALLVLEDVQWSSVRTGTDKISSAEIDLEIKAARKARKTK
ncbi:MAG: type II toxin-antitoxin system Phd/YefM family antitoxin [Candidatus Margulisiibacteriota bacterium]|jgi:hypothetical protein